jgi:hypothetical protein
MAGAVDGFIVRNRQPASGMRAARDERLECAWFRLRDEQVPDDLGGTNWDIGGLG